MSSPSQSLESHGGFAANKDMHSISSNTDWYNPPITLSTIPALALPMLEHATGLQREKLVEHINACVSDTHSAPNSMKTYVFATGDIWADDPLEKLGAGNKTFGIVQCSSFLHIFSFDQQVRIAKPLAGFLSEKPDTLIFGWTTGTVKAGEYAVGRNEEARAYTHNVESFQRLWEDFGKQTRTKWHVEAVLQEAPGMFDRIANTEAWGQGFPERMFLKFSVQKS